MSRPQIFKRFCKKVLRPATSAFPGNYSEMQILRFYPRHPESRTPNRLCFNKPSGQFWAKSGLRTVWVCSSGVTSRFLPLTWPLPSPVFLDLSWALVGVFNLSQFPSLLVEPRLLRVLMSFPSTWFLYITGSVFSFLLLNLDAHARGPLLTAGLYCRL